MSALADQVHDGPMILPALQLTGVAGGLADSNAGEYNFLFADGPELIPERRVGRAEMQLIGSDFSRRCLVVDAYKQC